MMKRSYWGVIVGIMMCACSSTDRNPVEAFAEVTPLKGDTVANLEEYEIFTPVRVIKKDSVFVIRPLQGECLLYELNPYTKKCRELIRKGKGPGETLDLYTLRMTDGDHACASGLNSDKIADLTFGRDSVTVDFIQLKNTILPAAVRGSDFIAGTCRNEQGVYAYYDLADSTVDYFCDYPEIPDAPKADRTIKQIYYASSDVAMSPDQSRMAWILFPGGMMDLCKVGDHKIERYKTVQFYAPRAVIEENSNRPVRFKRDNKHGFCDVVTTNDRIYTIYSGRTFEQAGTGFDDCHYLMVFDWEGNPKKCYELEQSVSGIFYDEKENAVYAVSSETEAMLLRFGLSDVE